MILPEAQRNYDFVQENQRNNLIEQADNLNRKKNQDIELRGERLILQSPNGTRFSITVADNGTVSAVSL
jgi:phosphosulfolactate phosphohydrolase-like enzyme